MTLKKKFFEVEIPLIGDETELLAYELEDLKGKTIKIDLTRVLRGKGVELKSSIEVEGNNAYAIPQKMVVMPYYIRRAVRKGTNYIEDSFKLSCKDGEIVIKPFLVTRKKVSRAVRKTLRENAKKFILDYTKDKEIDEIFDDLIKNRLQKTLSLILKKIYPLSLCEIRILEVKKRFLNPMHVSEKKDSNNKKTVSEEQ